jgi:2-C-methyl-D-erythritol 4-phosphate cytidylyltransferase
MGAVLPKQYLRIADKTLLEHCLDVFVSHPDISDIVICLHPEDRQFANLEISKNPKVSSVIGGATRAESVLQGLYYVKQHSQNKIVLVHDAARPGLTHQALNRLLAYSLHFSSAILAIPVIDTIKQVVDSSSTPDHAVKIARTLDRTSMWQAQTPQMFNVEKLCIAIETSLAQGAEITDEASAIEFIGDEVHLIEGEARNMKVTRPEDLEIMQFYLSQRDTL